MKVYKLKVKIGETETPQFEYEAKDWEAVCKYVFENIEIIDCEEEEELLLDNEDN